MKVYFEINNERASDMVNMVYNLAKQGDLIAEDVLNELDVEVTIPITMNLQSTDFTLSFSMTTKDFLEWQNGEKEEEYLSNIVMGHLYNRIDINFDAASAVIGDK